MQHEEFESPEELKDAINCFWHNSIDFAEQHKGFEVVPDGYAEIIFYFGGPLSISHNAEMQVLPSPFIVGLLNKPVIFYAKKHSEVIGIRCYPWSVFDLLGIPSAKGGVHMFEHPVKLLQVKLKQLIQKHKLSQAIDLIKQYFLNTRKEVSANSILFKAGSAMMKANGTLPVKGVAEAAHATIRTLERKFKKSSGHSIKDISALMRFEQVRNTLWLHPGTNLAGLAFELGYTDQAHLSKEFKRYSGTTPAAFARETKKRKQMLNNDFVVFIQE